MFEIVGLDDLDILVEDKPTNLNVKFHTVMFDLKDCIPDDALEFFKEAQDLIPAKDIYPEHPYKPMNPDGREDEPHVTVLFGLTKSEDYEAVKKMVEEFGMIYFKFGNISAFRNPESPHDVLKIEIISEELNKLHYKIRETFDNKCTFEFNGHTTLSYIIKDSCKDIEGKFAGTGKEYLCKQMIFSDRDEGYKYIPLKDKGEENVEQSH